MTTSYRLLQTAATCRLSAKGLRELFPSANQPTLLVISQERADVLAAIFDDLSALFNEMAEVVDGGEEAPAQKGRGLL
jgi:hypothetical protein